MKSKTFTSNFSYKHFQVVIFLAIFSFITLFSSAQSVSWTGPTTGGDWATASNWSGGKTPAATDSVFIASGNQVTLSTDAGIINSMTVQGKLTVASGGILAIEQNRSSISLLQINGGEVDNAGSITLTQKLANINPGIALADGTANSTFKNTGVLSINMSLTGATGNCVSFKQASGGTATFVLGGTMTFTPAAAKNIFSNLLGNGQIDGTAVIGSATAYQNYRLLQVAGGHFTILPNANIEFYCGLTTGAIVMINNAGTAILASTATLTNNGTLMIHANSAVTSNAIQFSPGAFATSTLANSGTIIADGTYISAGGVISCAGTDATSYAVINNLSGGMLSATNTYGTSITTGGTTSGPALTASNTKNATVNNAGVISLNSTGRCMLFGGSLCTFNNNSGGLVTVTTAITGSSSNTGACNIYNNTGATFDFNVPLNPNVGTIANAHYAIHNAAKILFTNSGGTVTGRGTFMTGLFVPSTGTIAPGNGNGATPYGQFQINGTPEDFSKSTLSMKIGGKTAGTNCDQILLGTVAAAANISNTTLNLTFDAAYAPASLDSIALIKTSTSTAPTITGNFASTTLPTGWALNYTSDVTRLIYTAPNALQNVNVLNAKIYAVDNQLKVTIGDNMSAELKLMDLTGRTIIEVLVKGQNNSIKTVNLKGIYIVRLKTERGDYSQKVSL